MTKYYKDFYGSTAKITGNDTGAKLIVRAGGKIVKNSKHKSFNCARSAMYRYSDGWNAQ